LNDLKTTDHGIRLWSTRRLSRILHFVSFSDSDTV